MDSLKHLRTREKLRLQRKKERKLKSKIKKRLGTHKLAPLPDLKYGVFRVRLRFKRWHRNPFTMEPV